MKYPKHSPSSSLSALFQTCLFICISILILTVTQSFALDVSFVWTANTDEPPVDGYRLYYKIGDPSTTLSDYNGTDANNSNPSPIEITGQDTTSYQLLNLLDTETYSFALTAFRGTEESEPTSALSLAADTTGTRRSISFSWTANTDEPLVDGYRLYYKTGDPGSTLLNYDGTDADNANFSPIDIQGQSTTSYTLPNLLNTESYSFVLTAYRDTAESDPTTAITLGPSQTNEAPTASTASITTNKNIQYSGQLVANDPNGDVLTYNIVTNGNKGTATITDTATGAYTYSPNQGVDGADSFTFMANDGILDSNTATVTVEIMNSAPTADSASFSVNKNQTFSGQLSAADADTDPITFSIVTAAAKGTASILNPATGQYTYTPTQGASGSDSFTFKVNDGTDDSNTATVSATIINTAPTADDLSFSTERNQQYSGQLVASDTDNDPLTYSIVTSPGKGTATITDIATGAFTYTPTEGAEGVDTFTFKVNDGTDDSNTATVSVNTVNAEPTATAATVSVNKNQTYSGQLTASDPNNDALTYAIVTNAGNGSAAITDTATGAFTYTPNQGVSGADSFTFKASDGIADSNTATITVEIVNTAPLATDATVTIDKNQTYSGQLEASDSDNDSLTFSIVTPPDQGAIVITDTAIGAFTYTPDTGASGTDTFTFKANDGTDDSNTANVAITIGNNVPIASSASISVDMDIAYSGYLAAYDPDNDPLTYSLVSSGSSGVASITDAATGAFTYTPNDGALGSDTFTYKVNDGSNDSAEATISVTIYGDNVVTKIFGSVTGADYPGTITDTFVNVNTDVNATSETLGTYSWADVAPHKPANTTIIKVDLSDLPSKAKIAEARLYLYQTQANGEPAYTNTVHKIIGKDPVISQATGYNAFSGEPWTPLPTPGTTYNDIPLGLADIDTQADSVVLLNRTGYQSWLITDMVNDWFKKSDTNYGLLIKGAETSIETGRTFASSENLNEDIRPMIVIRYATSLMPPKLLLIEEKKTSK